MKRSRTAIVAVAGLLTLVLAGCEAGETGGANEGMQPDSTAKVRKPRPAGVLGGRRLPPGGPQSPTCKSWKKKALTGPIAWISVQAGAVSVHPDTIVQPVGSGALLWGLDPGTTGVDSFEVSFKKDSTPLADTAFLGDSGGLVGGVVRSGADCAFYPYSVKVWRDGNDDALTADPGGDIQPRT